MIDKNLFINKNEEKFLENVKENLYFEEDIKKYFTEIEEKKSKPDLLGKTIKVTEKQFSKVNKIINDTCKILKLYKPEAFVFEDFYYGVEAKGIEKPWLEISAKTIADFSENQLRFIISRELYNIKFKNTYYQNIIKVGLQTLEKIVFPGTDIAEDVVKTIFYKWIRSTSYSADNFGLAICGDLKDATKSILLTILNNKDLVNEVNVKEYIKQGDEINLLNDEIYSNTKLDEMVPYGPFRIKNIISFYNSERGMKATKEIEKEKR